MDEEQVSHAMGRALVHPFLGRVSCVLVKICGTAKFAILRFVSCEK